MCLSEQAHLVFLYVVTLVRRISNNTCPPANLLLHQISRVGRWETFSKRCDIEMTVLDNYDFFPKAGKKI